MILLFMSLLKIILLYMILFYMILFNMVLFYMIHLYMMIHLYLHEFRVHYPAAPGVLPQAGGLHVGQGLGGLARAGSWEDSGGGTLGSGSGFCF